MVRDLLTHFCPALRQCEAALDELKHVFDKACPQADDGHGRRIWKATARAVFFGRDSKVRELMTNVQDNLELLEKLQICFIDDKLEALQHATTSLAEDENSRYQIIGDGTIFANEGGRNENYGVAGRNNRQIIKPGVYNEGTSST